MGYEIHITRRKHWTDDGNDIRVEEWLEFVRSHDDFQLDLRNGPYHTLWNNSEDYWLDWNRGELYTKSPEYDFVLKMVEIAQYLNAHVMGDDGELYPEALAKYTGNQTPQ